MTAYERARLDRGFQCFLARCLGRPFEIEKEGWRFKGFIYRGITYFTEATPFPKE